ncbi:hypothetical protein V8B97DRAFT_1875763 [Scleroderma yunnanense]
MYRPEHQGRPIRRANPKTIQDKFLVGYQGWFTCAGDGDPIYPGHNGWLHWTDGLISQGGRPNLDFWPDISEYSPSELFPVPGLHMADGGPAFVFSSRHPKTVRRHFHWMALHDVDGAFLQRFVGQCDVEMGNQGIRRVRDEIGKCVKEAAEAEGRVFAIMYDVSGVALDRVQKVLEQDWIHLLREECVLDSPNYLHEKGKPVVALWGFGLNDRHHTPDLVRSVAAFFRSATPGGVYLMAGVPGHWRTSTSDADRNPEFVPMWTDVFDAISPWTVGRYGNEEDADRWGEERVKADADYLKKLGEETGKKVDYVPVVLPGGSGYNLSQGKWGRNDIKRNGGKFLWKQIYNARRAGVRTIYGAMWDEYDEGTVFMPIVPKASQLPVHPDFTFLALDVDGYDLPSDWYMRIVGYAAEGFHGERVLMETFPIKELKDYWSSRPHYVEDDAKEQESRRIEAAGQAYKEWEEAGAGSSIGDAPPPYSVEELVEQTQAMALSQGHPSGSGNGDAFIVHHPSDTAPRVPSLFGSQPAASPPSRHYSVSAASIHSSAPSSALPPRAQSARPAPVNMSSRPTFSGRPPPVVNASARPSPPSVNVAARPPHPPSALSSHPNPLRPTSFPADGSPPPTPSTKPYSHFSPERAKMNMPSAVTPSASMSGAGVGGGEWPGEWQHHQSHSNAHHSPSHSVSHTSHLPTASGGRPISPPSDALYNPSIAPTMSTPLSSGPYSIGGPQDTFAAPYSSPGGWAFPAPMHVGSDEYAYPNQSVSMGPHLPYHYGSPPHSLSPQPGFTHPSSPPPALPPRPPMHPQSSGYYAPYVQGSPYGSAYNNYGYNTSNNDGGVGGQFAGRALNAVESVAGRDVRAQLERGVKTLANTGSSLLNKFK